MVRSTLAVALLLLVMVNAAHGHAHLGGAGGEGTFVNAVNPGSPAAAAGLQQDDRLVRLDGQEIETIDDLRKIMATGQPGEVVMLVVQREGEMVDLELAYGELPGGGVSMGASLSMMAAQGAGDAGSVSGEDAGAGTAACLAWVEETYRIDAMLAALDLDLEGVYEDMRTCIGGDTRRMSAANAVRYCDNIFKVHCSGVDLLTEIGEAQVEQCEEQLNESLGLRLGQYNGWRTCAEQAVFERYAKSGESSDEDACRSALLDECGTNIAPQLASGQLSSEQSDFVQCCSAESLGDPGSCQAIDDGFSRGPCLDQSVCINRLTSEWLLCSDLE